MAIEPKVLNQANSKYGPKKSQKAWRRLLSQVLGSTWTGDVLAKGIKDFYDDKDYSRTIVESLKLLRHYRNPDDLEDMTEADLAAFYYLGMSYYKLGDIEKAISCLHIVLSQNRFVQSMLIGFSQFVDMAFYELEKLAAQYGDEHIKNNDPGAFLQRKED